MISLHVSNIAFQATAESLRDLFSTVGPVETARIVTDPETGRSRGFGFVDMTDEVNAALAIDRFNDYEWQGQPLSVKLARPE